MKFNKIYILFFFCSVIESKAQDYQIARGINHIQSPITTDVSKILTQSTYPLGISLVAGYIGYGYFKKKQT